MLKFDSESGNSQCVLMKIFDKNGPFINEAADFTFYQKYAFELTQHISKILSSPDRIVYLFEEIFQCLVPVPVSESKRWSLRILWCWFFSTTIQNLIFLNDFFQVPREPGWLQYSHNLKVIPDIDMVLPRCWFWTFPDLNMLILSLCKCALSLWNKFVIAQKFQRRKYENWNLWCCNFSRSPSDWPFSLNGRFETLPDWV